jgi:ActR/RegA family two-component response regulator
MNLEITNPNRLLVLDDDERMISLIENMARPIGFETNSSNTASGFIVVFKHFRPSVVVLDIFLQNEDSMRAIDFLGRSQFKGAVILVSGFDYRFLRSVGEVARDHGLHLLGTVEKGAQIEKVESLIRAAYIGSLRPLLPAALAAESRG